MDEKQTLKIGRPKSKSTRRQTTTSVSNQLNPSIFSSRMPTEEHIQRILNERALKLGVTMKEEANIIRETFVRIRLGMAERYGISYKFLEHITKFDSISRIPCTPSVIAGVVNYRGILLTILDLKQLFCTKVGEASTDSWVIVVRFDNLRVGLLVDEVEGSDEFKVAELEPPIHTGGILNLNYVQGIYHGEVTILKIQGILTDPQLRVEENLT